MNPISKLIFKWYCFLTVLGLVSAITIDISSLIPGFILLWIMCLIFFITAHRNFNFKGNKFYLLYKSSNVEDAKLYSLRWIFLISLAASLYAADFYTGKKPLDILAALTLGLSLYNDYQEYFIAQGLATLTIYKIPAILSMFYLKAALVYSFITVLVLRKSVGISNSIWLILISLPSLYFSIARGTSFEFFELLLLLWFCLSMRSVKYSNNRSIITAPNLILGAVALTALSLYSYNISARYSFGKVSECVTAQICLNADSNLFYLSQGLAELSLKLSGYFTFGLYYTSVLMSDYWLQNGAHFLGLIFPFSLYYLIDGSNNFICGNLLDCGVAWVPDVSLYILQAGFLFIFVSVYLIGVLVRRITPLAFSSNDIFVNVILYFVFLGMVSLPVGNFLTTSSANILLLFFVVSVFVIKKISKLFT